MLELKLAAQPVYDGADEWSKLMRSLSSDMRALFERWRKGMDAEAFAQAFDSILFDGHTSAHMIGQTQADRGKPSIGVARYRARAIADEDVFFLRRFIQDLVGGRYTDDDGELEMDKVLRRSNLYVGKARGSASIGFVDAGDAKDRYEWVLGAAEDHCADCPELAAISRENPFTKDTLFQHPGDGSTPCLSNCLCHLVRQDGAESQRPI